MSHDGYIYTKKHGLVRGLPTYGVVQPERKVGHTNDDYIWEAVVIGAGYTGLIAARDLVKAGKVGEFRDKSCSSMLMSGRHKDPSYRGPRSRWWPNLERSSGWHYL